LFRGALAATVGWTVLAFCGVVLSVVTSRRVQRIDVRLAAPSSEGQTFLLIGDDSRRFVPANQRTQIGTPQQSPGDHADVILLVRVLSDGQVNFLSIPRDLLVALPDGAPVRITLTLGLGPQGPIDSLCRTLGIGVNHLLLIHFDGLERVVNAVGGVTVDVPAPLRDPMAQLDIGHGGPNHLDGQEALAFVRARHVQEFVHGRWVDQPGTSDGRSDHAMQLLAALAQQVRRSSGSLVTTVKQAWTVAGAVEVDRHTGDASLLRLLQALRTARASRLELAVVSRSGDVPIANLGPGAANVIAEFNQGVTPGCTFRPIPLSVA
jgi:LCP family protein required for cell wall assembly